MRIGLEVSATHLGAEELLRLSKVAEQSGVDSLWVSEDIGRDAVALLGALARSTSRLKLATGVINTYTRTPFLIAMAAVTLQELCAGRFILGLADAHTGFNEKMHGSASNRGRKPLRE